MRRTNLPGHALRSEGKPYVPNGIDDEWIRQYRNDGVGLCECGATSPVMTSNAARQRWHRDVHKPEVRAALSSKGETT